MNPSNFVFRWQRRCTIPWRMSRLHRPSERLIVLSLVLGVHLGYTHSPLIRATRRHGRRNRTFNPDPCWRRFWLRPPLGRKSLRPRWRAKHRYYCRKRSRRRSREIICPGKSECDGAGTVSSVARRWAHIPHGSQLEPRSSRARRGDGCQSIACAEIGGAVPMLGRTTTSR